MAHYRQFQAELKQAPEAQGKYLISVIIHFVEYKKRKVRADSYQSE